MLRLSIFSAVVLAISFSSIAEAQFVQVPRTTGTRDGALIGGAAGAVIGGLVGRRNDRPLGGAVVGGAVGALAGAAIGNQRDQRIRQSFYGYGPYPGNRRPVYQYQARPVYPVPVRPYPNRVFFP